MKNVVTRTGIPVHLLIIFCFSVSLASCDLMKDKDTEEETGKKECELNKTGNFCFKNNSAIDLGVYVYDSSLPGGKKYATLYQGQVQCFYNLSAKAMTYQAWDDPTGSWGTKYAEGQIQVVQCETDTLVIN